MSEKPDYMSDEEWEEWKKTHTPTIHVNVDSKEVEKILKEKIELEKELENKTTEAEDYKLKLVMVAEQNFERKKRELGAPDWINDPKTLKEWQENQPSNVSAGVTKLGSAQLGESSRGFDSIEELIDAMHRAEREGDKGAKLVLNQLFHKAMRGQAQPFKKMEFKGEVDVEGREKGLIETMNEEFREEQLRKKKERDEDE